MEYKYLLLCLVSYGTFFSCNSSPPIPDIEPITREIIEKTTQATIQIEALVTANVFYYKGIDFSFTTTEVHGGGRARVRFNATANGALVGGKLPENARFPEGSLIVKEIYNGDTNVNRGYAVMKKNSTHEYQSGTWIWTEFPAQGQSYFNIPVTSRGAQCTGCHSSDTYDRTLIFTRYP